MPEDFADKGTRIDAGGGAKGKQRKTDYDTAAEYRRWHRGLGRRYYATDIDQVEWRQSENGGLEPVAIFELTRVQGPGPVPPAYFDKIIDRFEKRDGQGDMARLVGERLGCKAWIVVFRAQLDEFWVYNLTDRRGWFGGMREKSFADWVRSLGKSAPLKVAR